MSAIPGCECRNYPHAECGKPSVIRYAAMGGGYCYLCGVHGARHTGYAERLIDGQWVPPERGTRASINPPRSLKDARALLSAVEAVANLGVGTDGAHHKQWALCEILRTLGWDGGAVELLAGGDTGVQP